MHCFVGTRRRAFACSLAAAFALCAAPAVAHADCPGADLGPGQGTPAQLSGATVCLLNQQRAAAGLGPLTPSQPLAITAANYAAYMVAEQHFAHQDLNGHDVVYRVLQTDPALAGHWLAFGENLGWGSYSDATPRALVTGWMNSPEHRANILYPEFDQVGVGTAPGAPQPGVNDALTYTTVFAKLSPQSSAPKPHRKAHHHRRGRARTARKRARGAAHRRRHSGARRG